MKRKIFLVALVLMGMLIMAQGEAPGCSLTPPPIRGVNQQVFGHLINVVEGVEEGEVTRRVFSGIAKGQPFAADLTAVVWDVFPAAPPVPDPRCPDELPFATEIIRLQWGETYSDGSLLAGDVWPPGQVFCTDGDQAKADLVGLITKGTGRFEDAAGSPWRMEVSSQTTNIVTTGTLTVELD